MTHIAAIILGFIEGATEFIPVSSSGHLIMGRAFLGLGTEGSLTFDAVLQLATSSALLVYFWREITRLIQTAWRIITRQIVEQKEKILLYAIIFGLLLEKQMDTIFRNVHLVALTLILGSLLMYFAQKYSRKVAPESPVGELGKHLLTIKKGITIGFFQCLALVPGVSRSGATISGGLFSGLTQEEATRFSFLLSLPVLFGAGFKKLYEVRHDLFSSTALGTGTTGYGSALLLGSLTAFIVGLLSIRFLMRYLKTHNLNIFIWYRILIAIVILLFL